MNQILSIKLIALLHYFTNSLIASIPTSSLFTTLYSIYIFKPVAASILKLLQVTIANNLLDKKALTVATTPML